MRFVCINIGYFKKNIIVLQYVEFLKIYWCLYGIDIVVVIVGDENLVIFSYILFKKYIKLNFKNLNKCDIYIDVVKCI